MEMTDEKYLEKLGEEQRRGRKAFGAGYLRGLSVVNFVRNRNREIKMEDNEKQAFMFGQNCGFGSVCLALLAVIWIFVGG